MTLFIPSFTASPTERRLTEIYPELMTEIGDQVIRNFAPSASGDRAGSAATLAPPGLVRVSLATLPDMDPHPHQSDDRYPRQYLYRRAVRAKMFIDANYARGIDLGRVADEACFRNSISCGCSKRSTAARRIST